MTSRGTTEFWRLFHALSPKVRQTAKTPFKDSWIIRRIPVCSWSACVPMRACGRFASPGIIAPLPGATTMTGFGFGSAHTKNLTGVFRNKSARAGCQASLIVVFRSIARRLIDRFFLEPAHLVFQLGHAEVEALHELAHLGRQDDTIRAVMPRGVAALDRIFKFFAAGATSTGTLTGGDFFHDGRLAQNPRHAIYTTGTKGES